MMAEYGTEKKGYAGRKKRLDHLAKLRPVYLVEIRTQNTTADAGRIKEPKMLKSKSVQAWLKPRSAGENAKILNSQKKAGRNFAHVSKKNFRLMQTDLRKALSKFEEGGSPTVIGRGLKGIGESLIERYQKNLDEEKSPRRPFKPLGKHYSKFKDRMVGKRPILDRTGQLRKSIFFRVVTK
jgi:hypothetical protein